MKVLNFKGKSTKTVINQIIKKYTISLIICNVLNISYVAGLKRKCSKDRFYSC